MSEGRGWPKTCITTLHSTTGHGSVQGGER